MNEAEVKDEVSILSPSRRQIKVEIEASEVENEYQKILVHYISRAKIPGFRKGHAPRELVKKTFNSDIWHEVYDNLIPRSLEKSLKAKRLTPLGTPKIIKLSHNENEPLRFTAEFEVMPDFDLPEYDKIQVDRVETEVKAEDVEKAVEELRQRSMEYVPVEGRGVVDGDYVVIEIQGKDVRTKKLMPAEKGVVLAGNKDNEPGLNEALKSMNIGETKLFNVSYPEDYNHKNLAGKQVEYRITVKEIKEKKLPSTDEDFIRNLGNYADLNELKEKIKSELITVREREARSKMAREILRAIAARTKIDLPDILVETETLSIVNKTLENFPGSPVSPENLEKIKQEARKQAIENLTHHLILEKIADREGIKVSEEEIREEVSKIAIENRLSPEAVEDYIKKENRKDDLVHNLLFRKSVDFLLRKVIIA